MIRSIRTPARSLLTLLSLALLASSPAGAAEKEWDYPELVVSPRASERLEREARSETGSSLSVHWPLLAPATALLATGLVQLGQTNALSDPDRYAAWTGIGVGSGWLATLIVLSRAYQPYSAGMTEIATMPSKNLRDSLARERAAERHLQAASRLASRLKWIQFVSSLATSGYLIGNSENGSLARTFGVASLVVSLTPLIFQHHWIDVASEQQDYKKRIFGPIAAISAAPTVFTASSGEPAPGLAMQLQW